MAQSGRLAGSEIRPHQRLEWEFGRWAGAENVVACSSGTAALHLALEALRLPPGSEVLVPDLTMIACARAVTLAGLVPVFVDCGDDLLMDTDLLKRRGPEENDFHAAVVVHIYGRRQAIPDDFPAWFVIEDLAEAHGVKPHPATNAACWSFYRNKIVAGEEGGAVAFRDPAHAALARELRCLGFTAAHDFRHTPRGHNYRLADALALPILDSLRHVDINMRRRRQIEGWYDAQCPAEWKMPARDAVWVYDLRIPGLTAERQDALVRRLRDAGVEARHCFQPMSAQPEYRGCRVVGSGNAARLAREVIYLPAAPGVTTEWTARLAFDVIRREVGA